MKVLAVMFCVALFQPADAPRPDDLSDLVQRLEARLQALEAENADLRSRVRQLEAALINSSGPTKAKTPTRHLMVMELEEVRRSGPAASDLSEIDRLLQPAEDLDKAAASKRRGADGDSRHPLSAEARRIARKADRSRASAKKIRTRIAGRSYFWLLGWDGRRDVMLWTDGIDKAVIEQFVLGQFVGFTGDEIETALGHPIDEDFVTYRATEVKTTSEPRTFTYRRPHRTPVWRMAADQRASSPFPRLPAGVGSARR